MSRGNHGSDKDKAKMSLHNFAGSGETCDTCGLSKRHTVHAGADYKQPPGVGYSEQTDYRGEKDGKRV